MQEDTRRFMSLINQMDSVDSDSRDGTEHCLTRGPPARGGGAASPTMTSQQQSVPGL